MKLIKNNLSEKIIIDNYLKKLNFNKKGTLILKMMERIYILIIIISLNQ